MKRLLKKILSSVMIIAVILSSTSISKNTVYDLLILKASAKNTIYNVGDIIEFGLYPQSKVKDTALLTNLDSVSKNWVSYNYMESKNQKGDYMQYADIVYGGDKYRAVRFSKYRPSYTTYTASVSCENFQFENGYYVNTTYYFKYEPIKWRILDPNSGLVLCETLIDAQPFNDFDYDGYVSASHNNYINDWESSSARTWLNSTFFNLAFSQSEKQLINEVSITNSGHDNTVDRIFLLSCSDITNDSYGFTSNSYRKAQGTDYSKCQGLGCSNDGYSCWRLRTAGVSSCTTCHIHIDGTLYCGSVPTATNVVVRPSCYYNGIICKHDNVSKLEATKPTCNSVGYSEGYICNDCGKIISGCKTIDKINHFDNNEDNFCDFCDAYLSLDNGDIIEFGMYPQSRITDTELIESLSTMDLNWISYNYYSGTGHSGTMKSSDYMKFADVYLNGEKYRAVRFTSYRPFNTYHNSSSSESYQDNNGYTTNNIYWFKYEPIKWKILDISKGLLISEKILDSQAINNICYNDWGTHIDQDYSIMVNNWEMSTLRKWLSSDFMNIAFDNKEKEIIIPSDNTNNGFGGVFNFENTIDTIFLLSSEDIVNTNFGFSSSYYDCDLNRIAYGTDYAKSQGLKVSSQGTSWWRLRSAGSSSENIERLCHVGANGEVNNITDPTDPVLGEAYCNDSGVRPAIIINLNSYLCNKNIHEFGEWSVTKKATTINDGIENRFCSHCNKQETRYIPKLEPITVQIQDNLNINYKSTNNVTMLVHNPCNIKTTISYSSSDSNIVSVDKNGKVYGTKTGSAIITCTVTDEYGNTVSDTCNVSVSYTWWQWIIEIVLFGWIWY